jgi:hypothetical protein
VDQLAKALNVPPATVTDILAGHQPPRDEMQVRSMEQALGTDGVLLRVFQRTRATTDSLPEQDWDRAGARAFLQRGEVRLSTLHRVAGLLLGGAGLLLLVPALFGQALPALFDAFFLIWRIDPVASTCLAAVVVISFAAPLWGYLLILEDLAGFFFAGKPLGSDDELAAGRPQYHPTYSLTGLRLAHDEAPPWLFPQISDAYAEHLAMVVPDSPAWRRQFDDRVKDIYQNRNPIPDAAAGDRDRLLYAMRLAASERRTLASEVSKMELSMVKHISQVQIVVLRYLKAMLLVLITAITVLVAASLTTADRAMAADRYVVLEQLLVVFLLWPPLAAGAVASPIRWIYRHSTADQDPAGRPRATLRDAYADRRLVRFENAIVFLCLVATGLAGAASILAAIHGARPLPLVLAAVVAATVWVFVHARWWKGNLRDTPGAFVQLLTSGAGPRCV